MSIAKRFIAFFVVMALSILPVCGAPGDSKEKTAAVYGEYRMVIDTEDKTWTSADWESQKKGRIAETYVHYFFRQGVKVSMVAFYDSKGGAHVIRQHFSLDTPVSIKQFKALFPEVYSLICDVKATTFIIASGELNGKFTGEINPISFGVVVEKEISPKFAEYNTLLAFNLRDNGRLIKDARFIDENATISEFVMERVATNDVWNKLHVDKTWKPVANYFKK